MSNHKNNQENHGHNHAHCDHHDHHEHNDAHYDHHEHNHAHCDHHGHHDHGDCAHHHHHSHGMQASHSRHIFSADELKRFETESMETLMQYADDYLNSEEYGKVVPIFEIALSNLMAQNLQDSESTLDSINLKQNLAFSYGIIGEHASAIPLWKSVIAYKEQNGGDDSDLLDDYFGIALSCEQCEMDQDFLLYIQKGLKLAKENQFEEYVASFEHELGGFYCDLSDFQKSETHLKNAIKIREKLGDVVGLAMSKMYMGIMFNEQKKYDEAKQFYESALELTKNEDYSDELVNERAELEQRLSLIKNANLKDKLLNL